MDNEISLVPLQNGNVTLTKTGLILAENMPYDEWEAIGGALQRIGGMIRLALGDWINYGEHNYGEKYAQAIEQTEYAYKTLRNSAYVAGNVDMPLRRDNLGFEHHQLVSPLTPDLQWDYLQWAEDEGATVKELKRKIKMDRLTLKAPLVSEQHIPPLLYHGQAESMPFLEDNSIELIITSPPYNLGEDAWPMGGGGRIDRPKGIGYQDNLTEDRYQDWQVACLEECYRVATFGASMFYNHKVRIKSGASIHPIDWLRRSQWVFRQEIIWDRKSTHNHSPSLFWPEDERVYWLTKGKPILPHTPIGRSSIWREFGPVPNQSWHPAPFAKSLPLMLIKSVGTPGATILDPFVGSGTTLFAATDLGYPCIGVDCNLDYLRKLSEGTQWMIKNEY